MIRGPSVWLSEDDHPEDRFIIENTVILGDMEITNGTVAIRNSVLVNTEVTMTNVTAPVFTSSVFAGGGCSIRSDLPIVAEYNDFFDNVGWCDGQVLIGTIQPGSPLVGVGNPDAAYSDPDGSRNDIGLTGGRFSVLGGW